MAAAHLVLWISHLRENKAFILSLEPVDRVLLGYAVGIPNTAVSTAATRHAVSRPAKNNVEIHAINASVGIILNPEIDVLLNAEAEVTRAREVATAQFKLLHTEASFENFFSLFATNSHMGGNLFVLPDTKTLNGQAS